MLDYHVHTRLCNHARGRLSDYVHEARAKGIRELAFLDHLTLEPSASRSSMSPEEVPFYVNAVRELARAWKGHVAVRAGLEIDFCPEAIATIEEIVSTFDFDLIGTSIHFLDGLNIASRRSRKALAEMSVESVQFRYLDRLEQLLEFDYYDVVCHLDVAERFAPVVSPSLRKALDARYLRILDGIRDKNVAVEINTAGLTQPIGRPYPSDTLLAGCVSRGIPLTLASDAHAPADVGRRFSDILPKLADLGISHICGFHRRTPFRLSL